VNEIAVMYEKVNPEKNLTWIMSRGYLRGGSTKQNIDQRRKLKINSVKWKSTFDYDITQEKYDIPESCQREKHS
jgi:hypothetical protein